MFPRYYKSLYHHQRRLSLATKSKSEKKSPRGTTGAGDAAGDLSSRNNNNANSSNLNSNSGGNASNNANSSNKKRGQVTEVGAPAPQAYDMGRGKKIVVEPPPITPYEIVAMAKYLKIDVIREFHLLWICEEALKMALPPQYEEYVDENGWPFFYDTERDEASREHPLDDYIFDLVSKERERKRTRREMRELDLDVMKPWMKFRGQMGNTYYYNFKTQSTAEDLPDAPEIDTSAKVPRFRFVMKAPEYHDTKRLVFFSWYTENGEINERVEVCLTYNMITEEFRASYGKNPNTFSGANTAVYGNAAASVGANAIAPTGTTMASHGRSSAVVPTTRYGENLEPWDLALGISVNILGRRHTLLKADASTIEFIDFNVRRLERHRKILAEDLELFETVPEALAETIKGDKAHVSMRQVMKQIIGLKQRLNEWEAR